MGLLSFFLKLFKFKPAWNGSPESFLAMVMELQSKNNVVYSEREVLQWGEVMQNVIKVNLSPYRDFADLLANGSPDFALVEKMRDKMAVMEHRKDLKKALYGENVDLGDDDVMKSDSEDAKFAREMVKDLSAYVEFRKEDQDIINKLK